MFEDLREFMDLASEMQFVTIGSLVDAILLFAAGILFHVCFVAGIVFFVAFCILSLMLIIELVYRMRDTKAIKFLAEIVEGIIAGIILAVGFFGYVLHIALCIVIISVFFPDGIMKVISLVILAVLFIAATGYALYDNKNK